MSETDEGGLDDLARICAEAARRHGDDWPRLKASIEDDLARLGPLARCRLESAIRETLSFEPRPPAARLH